MYNLPLRDNMDIVTPLLFTTLTSTDTVNKSDNYPWRIVFILFLTKLFNGDICQSMIDLIKSTVYPIIHHWVSKRTQDIATHANKLAHTPSIQSRIEFVRDYSNGSDASHVLIDALIDHITNLDTSMQLERRRVFLMTNRDQFLINKDVFARVLGRDMDKTENIQRIRFEIYSYTWTLSELRTWLTSIQQTYEYTIQNEFGQKRFYFDEIHRGAFNASSNKYYTFSMYEFITNKSLNNLFGEEVERVRQRIERFKDTNWYHSKGIPHTLGILMHGTPGTGKTSLIKSIAHDLKRHIINISITKTTTKAQLKQLFYSDILHIAMDDGGQGGLRQVRIPIRERLYVIEEVDTQQSVMLDRQLVSNTKVELTDEDKRNIDILGTDRWKDMKTTQEPYADLGDVLTILDGVLEVPQRIILMTTNHPDKIDPAILRPGRMDLVIEFKNCSSRQLAQFFEHYYGADCTRDMVFDEMVYRYSPSYVQETILRFEDPWQAYTHLNRSAPSSP